MSVPDFGRRENVLCIRLPFELLKLREQLGAAGELRDEHALHGTQIGEMKVGFAAACVVPPGVWARTRSAGRVVRVVVTVAIRAGAAGVLGVAAGGQIHSPAIV